MTEMINKLFGIKQDKGKDKKTWIIENLSTSKNGKFHQIIQLFKSCDTNTKISIVQETAYLPVTEGLINFLAYIIKEEEEIVKKYAKNIVDARLPLRIQVLQNI
jgi:hypothetical protein